MKMTSILSGLTLVCAAYMFLPASRSQAFNKPTVETHIATVSVRYIVDDVGARITDAVRRLLSVIPQHAYLFNATLRDNILVARPDGRRRAVGVDDGPICRADDDPAGVPGREREAQVDVVAVVRHGEGVRAVVVLGRRRGRRRRGRR